MKSMDQTRARYNRIAPLYDLLTRGEKEAIRVGIHLLNVEEGERVLEVGCATGGALPSLTRSSGSRGTVIGLDLSEEMLSIAREKPEIRIMNIELVQGDARALPFCDCSVDALFMTFTLELFPDTVIPLVLEECRRVLARKGRLTVVSLAEGTNLAVHLYTWLHRRFPGYLDCRPIPLEQVIQDAGFETISRERISLWGLPVVIVAAVQRSDINRWQREVGV
jgi:ubiquinone/menaquinone biosynthesis C-methylase UbiE